MRAPRKSIMLSERELRRAEGISRQEYRIGTMLRPGVAECWREGENADIVYLYRREWRPYIVSGVYHESMFRGAA